MYMIDCLPAGKDSVFNNIKTTPFKNEFSVHIKRFLFFTVLAFVNHKIEYYEKISND